ncbi:MAG: tetratricopeptide repeat protein [Flavobacteriaceae bacterium]|nr:tetratricopeptide repeat protein [Flavobacteriaceae bacterium]
MKNRAYHNMTSWFNALFNGQKAMDDKLKELKTGHSDNYFEVLRVEPYDEFTVNLDANIITAPAPPQSGVGGVFSNPNVLNNQNSSLSGFEKAEEKALKVISDHSMMIRGEERNRLMERAYLMLGQARYYQGKPFQALDALQYARNLKYNKHLDEVKYFTALSQIQAGNKFAAEQILDPMYQNEKLGKQVKADVAKQLAWLYFLENDFPSALNGLDRAIKYTRSKDEEARLNYIQGQILTKMGRLDEANAKFARVYRLKPGFEMEARAQVAAALNFDPLAHNYSEFKNRLMKTYRVGTYELYRNELLYALGKMEEKRDSIQLAEKTYLEALRLEQSDPRFRAETFTSIGDIKFRKSDYVYAGAYYDSAVNVIPDSERKIEITAFRDNLKAVMEKYYLVQRNDSILKIAGMSDSDRKNFFENYIAELRKSDELKRQQEEVEATEFLTQTKRSSFGSSFEDNSGKFYFYSATAKSNGESEFQRVWGNRQLGDNWRISSGGSSIEDQKAELTGTSSVTDPRRYELDFYLEQIPKTQAALRNLKVQRDTTEFLLGLDYYDKFKDYSLATTTLEHLVGTPPHNEDLLLKSYYNLYKINIEKNPVLSAKYKDLVLNQFPNSLYAEFILNPQMDFSEENNPEVLELYNETFTAYKEDNFELVKSNATTAFETFPMAKIIPKFALLNAYADAQIEGSEVYRASLERILILYPGTDEAKHAQYLLDILDGKNKPKPQDSNPIGEFESQPANIEQQGKSQNRNAQPAIDNQNLTPELREAMKKREENRQKLESQNKATPPSLQNQKIEMQQNRKSN